MFSELAFCSRQQLPQTAFVCMKEKRASTAINVFRSLQALSHSYCYLQVDSVSKSTMHIEFQMK